VGGDWQDAVQESRVRVPVVPASATLAFRPNKIDEECPYNEQAAAKTPGRDQRPRTPKRPRNKQKIEGLRKAIAKLEEQLSGLQYRKELFSGASSEDWNAVKLEAQLWKDAAVVGLQKERLQAEASNRKLRKLLAAQVAFSTSKRCGTSPLSTTKVTSRSCPERGHWIILI
jgi:hypothetical protein